MANAYQTAQNLLANRDHTQQELRLKLQKKGFENAEISLALSKLASSGLINEARFVENYIYWRRNKGYGPLRISQELKARGVATETIAQLLDITDNAWLERLKQVWEKYFKSNLAGNLRERAKQMRFLQYRGFTQEQIENLINQISAEL